MFYARNAVYICTLCRTNLPLMVRDCASPGTTCHSLSGRIARALFEGEAGEHLRAVIRRQIDDLAQRAPQLGNADAILNFTQKIDH